MDCAALKQIFAGDRLEDLTPAESTAFEAHLDACAACRESLAEAEGELDDLASQWAPPEGAELAWARVGRAVEAQGARGVARPSRSRAPALLAMAAGLLLAVGIGLLAVISNGQSGPNGSPNLTSQITPPVNPNPIRPPANPPSGAVTTPDEVTIEAGEGYEAVAELLDGGVVCVTVRPVG